MAGKQWTLIVYQTPKLKQGFHAFGNAALGDPILRLANWSVPFQEKGQ
jgi:hypothetical protein